jgi:hypothetical protein
MLTGIVFDPELRPKGKPGAAEQPRPSWAVLAMQRLAFVAKAMVAL